ncbi:ABC transporter ATP-binding protein [Streptomyces niveus]|uniref:ABC transporter ATP-binding protein n=1 Tax=Streptomyces niveus TaxID=193462 RepID=UPI00365C9F44
MTKAITVAGLHKSFGRTHALDGLDLTVDSGEVHGFLGPNGAGKSTTIRVLLGLLRADSGAAQLLGKDPWKDAVALHRRLAYVPGDVELWPNLTGGEAIDLLSKLRGGLDRQRRDELIERFDLDPTKKGRAYSKGNRQKVAIVAALASDAELLLLDEPTAGLDPLMEVVFQDVILQAKAAGKTVLLSSHILAQVEKLCDRVSIIRLGRNVQSGTLSEMRHLTRTTVEAETERPATGLDTEPGIHGVRLTDRRVHFAVDGAHLDAAIRRLGEFGIRSLISHPPTLEELMLRHYGDELAVGGHSGGGGADDDDAFADLPAQAETGAGGVGTGGVGR